MSMQYSNQSNNNSKIKCLCDRRIQNSRTLEDVEFFEKFSQRLPGVNYFCKKLDLRWLIGLWIRLCAVLLTLKLSSTSYSEGKHLFILRNNDIRVISINNARMSLLSINMFPLSMTWRLYLTWLVCRCANQTLKEK